jgi:hypothetical protein
MSAEISPRQLLALKDRIVAHFTHSNWREASLLAGCADVVEDHPRLLRSLTFSDDDYEGNALWAVQEMVRRNPANYDELVRYLDLRYPDESGINVSSVPSAGPTIVFQPTVFAVPEQQLDPKLVSVMMPFEGSLRGVFDAIRAAAAAQGMTCQRADDIWIHSAVIQDVFSLLYRSFIVVCDFTGRNPNVFYEAGIAHTLGKHVIPITQSAEDIPFDLRHHRYLRYLNNGEGRAQLQTDVGKRIAQLLTQRG